MSTVNTNQQRGGELTGTDSEAGTWQTRIFLQPISPPSVLGLAGFSVATLMVALIQAGVLGSWTDMPVVGLFALFFGGVAQFTAAMWAFKARDAVATLAHGTWGSFWMAFGLLSILQITGAAPPAPHAADYALGLWFLGLAYMTMLAAIGATVSNLGVASVLWTLATGSALSSAGWFIGGIGSGWLSVGGYLFICSAALAAYVVLAMTLTNMTGRTILPLGELKKGANMPGHKIRRPIQLEWADPGVRHGQ